mgnify:CR=1 FL=1
MSSKLGWLISIISWQKPHLFRKIYYPSKRLTCFFHSSSSYKFWPYFLSSNLIILMLLSFLNYLWINQNIEALSLLWYLRRSHHLCLIFQSTASSSYWVTSCIFHCYQYIQPQKKRALSNAWKFVPFVDTWLDENPKFSPLFPCFLLKCHVQRTP